MYITLLAHEPQGIQGTYVRRIVLSSAASLGYLRYTQLNPNAPAYHTQRGELTNYSLRPEILVLEMHVSRLILVIDASILFIS